MITTGAVANDTDPVTDDTSARWTVPVTGIGFVVETLTPPISNPVTDPEAITGADARETLPVIALTDANVIEPVTGHGLAFDSSTPPTSAPINEPDNVVTFGLEASDTEPVIVATWANHTDPVMVATSAR